MIKIDKHIEIVSSGIGAFSCMARTTREAIQAILSKRYRSVSITLITTPDDLAALVARRPDLVFLGMKYLPTDLSLGANDPDKIWISEYLDAAGITYTGSAAAAVKLEASKQLAKQRVVEAGLATAEYAIVTRELPLATQDLPSSFPLFVKPSNRGGGVGIDTQSLARNQAELYTKLNSIFTDHQADALIEAYLPGREFSVSVLRDVDSGDIAVMPVEMITEADERGARVLGHWVKTSNVERVIDVPDSAIRQAACALAHDVFIALGARDYGRIDIRLDDKDVPHFLEANLYPSIADGYGSFPKAYKTHTGRSHADMILSIAALGLARNQDDNEELPALHGEFAIA